MRMSGGLPHEAAPLVGRGVAGAHADGRLRVGARRAARRRGGCPAAGCAGSSRRRRPGPAAATRRRAGCGACARSAAGALTSVSMPHRKADSVLPEPVGARISVCSPLGDGRPALRLRRRGLRERGARTRRAPPARTARADPAQPPGHGYRRPLTAAVRDRCRAPVGSADRQRAHHVRVDVAEVLVAARRRGRRRAPA